MPTYVPASAESPLPPPSSSPLERALNLALTLAATTQPLPAERLRRELYPPRQSDEAFARMFSRDKELLRAAGLTITFHDEDSSYSLPREDTWAETIELERADAAALALAGFALLDEPLFPLPLALRLALLKLSRLLKVDSSPLLGYLPAASALAAGADAAPPTLLLPEVLWRAVRECTALNLSYTNAAGQSSHRRVCPYGLFLLRGRWYLVGADGASAQQRVFAVPRISAVEILNERFQPPANFDVRRWVALPFQIGEEQTGAEQMMNGQNKDALTTIVIPPELADHALTLTRAEGKLSPRADEGLNWQVNYRNLDELLYFVTNEGLRFAPCATKENRALHKGLEAVVQAHA
ncbi:MAG: WYL domain-containing protein [Actinomycetes bacterium]|nr:WYL domain-containing protein [Actinomycetes bacterium]